MNILLKRLGWLLCELLCEALIVIALLLAIFSVAIGQIYNPVPPAFVILILWLATVWYRAMFFQIPAAVALRLYLWTESESLRWLPSLINAVSLVVIAALVGLYADSFILTFVSGIGLLFFANLVAATAVSPLLIARIRHRYTH